jgi:hypothetical protein
MSKVYSDIYQYIKAQEAAFAKEIKLSTGKRWNMKKHINRSVLYRDSDIEGSKTDFTPIKNITRPILNLEYRTETIDVKDVDIYADDKDKFHLSFLVKKYHDDVFTKEYDLDTFFDQLNQSRIDFGGALSKAVPNSIREYVPMESIAFCDQRDILSRPIGLKHSYSPDELMAMGDRGWGKTSNGATASLKDCIILARENTKDDHSENDIEVYEVHGNLPKRFVDPTDDSEEYETRMFIVAFYQKKDSQDKFGVTLYTKPEPKSPFKLGIRGVGIYGRALDFGGAEELFEPQVWVNYAMIREQRLLESASTTVFTSTDPAFTQKNKTLNLENNEVLDLAPDTEVKQLDTVPKSIRLFENAIEMWEDHAEKMGAATDPLQGEQSLSGTPFAAVAASIQQSLGLHDYRRGIFAKHLEEIYKDDYIPQIEKKICEGMTFLADLSLEEMQYVMDALVENETEKAQKAFVLSNGGQAMPPDMVDLFKQQIIDQFKKKGSRHFLEILKGEFKDVNLAVKVSIDGKSKNLGRATDTIVNILKFAFSNPQGFAMTMQIPGMAASFNQIIEYAGLSPVDFSGIGKMAISQPQQPQGAPGQPGPQGPQGPQGQPSPVQVQQPQYAK